MTILHGMVQETSAADSVSVNCENQVVQSLADDIQANIHFLTNFKQ